MNIEKIIHYYHTIFNLSSDTKDLIKCILSNKNDIKSLYNLFDSYVEYMYNFNIISYTELCITEDYDEFIEFTNNVDNIFDIVLPYILKTNNYIETLLQNINILVKTHDISINDITDYCISHKILLSLNTAVNEYIEMLNEMNNIPNYSISPKDVFNNWVILYSIKKFMNGSDC